MHDQKYNAKKFFYWPTNPIFFRLLQETNDFFVLELNGQKHATSPYEQIIQGLKMN